MAITPNDKLVAEMVHFVANRGVWKLTVRRSDGAFEPVAEGAFKPTLALDRDYDFEIEASDHAVTVRVPGDVITTEVQTVGLTGDRAFWEQYPTSTPAGVVFGFDQVWAE
ncbi:hypothetical protein FHR72_002769 [Mycolicibacterium iranicum]|uniref:Uncharacterized protein n=1 Tax=Mycolicibacterium iranicum TaxID=912594 RepID=A0A839QA07_MYCIR|nr:hypothetical protein [Mycolicibacterium iranicum]MBB2991285.1 hypothetical protein [Mycolicibacterium iranicum]